MFWTQLILCSWAIVSKLSVVVLRQTGHFFDENNLKLHGQCFWLLTVARGVVFSCFKRPFEDVRDVNVYDRSVIKLESFGFTGFFL